MKTVKKSFFRFFDKIIVLLLGCSGVLTGCEFYRDEYGMPSADFELKGTVTSSVTSEPLKNIRVIRSVGYEKQSGDTIYTDGNGKYAYTFSGFPGLKFPLKFEDIDGEANGGQFLTKEIEVTFTQADLEKKGDGHWYSGKFVKTQDAALERVTYAIPEYGIPTTSFQP